MSMCTWFRICRPNGEAVLADLKTQAAAGDEAVFKSSMKKWDAISSNMKWAKINDEDFFSRQCHDDIPNDKAVVLHRVLTVAAKAGQVNIARYLIEQRGCIIYYPALKAALMHEEWSVLELFLAKGWDINRSIAGNNTQTILVQMFPYENQVLWCLAHGADPMRRTLAQESDVASVAGRRAPLPVVKLLRKYGADYTKTDALQYAAEGAVPGRIEVLTYLIHEVKVPINQIELDFLPEVQKEWKCSLGTALHSAVKGRCMETLQYLLENGADRNKPDLLGRKPIDLAREEGFEEGVKLLKQ